MLGRSSFIQAVAVCWAEQCHIHQTAFEKCFTGSLNPTRGVLPCCSFQIHFILLQTLRREKESPKSRALETDGPRCFCHVEKKASVSYEPKILVCSIYGRVPCPHLSAGSPSGEDSEWEDSKHLLEFGSKVPDCVCMRLL